MPRLFQWIKLFTVSVFTFQAVYESRPWNISFPFGANTTPADSVTSFSDICEQQSDPRTISSNIPRSDVMVSEDGALFCKITQTYNVGRELSRAADVQIYDTEYACNSNTCNQVLRSSTSHETHTAGKSHECDVCHLVFKYPSKFNEHKRTHTGVKPFVCEVCDMAFSRANDLNRHAHVHSGIKRFACDICNKEFKDLRYMTKHKRIHSDVKPYSCDVSPVQDTSFSFDSCSSSAEKVTCVNDTCEQQPDQRDDSSNVSDSSVTNSEVDNVKVEHDDVSSSDDVLCSETSR